MPRGGEASERDHAAADNPQVRVTVRLPSGSDCAKHGPPYPHGVAIDEGQGGAHVQVEGADGAVRRLQFSQVASFSAAEHEKSPARKTPRKETLTRRAARC
jgi:hypothetical protein